MHALFLQMCEHCWKRLVDETCDTFCRFRGSCTRIVLLGTLVDLRLCQYEIPSAPYHSGPHSRIHLVEARDAGLVAEPSGTSRQTCAVCRCVSTERTAVKERDRVHPFETQRRPQNASLSSSEIGGRALNDQHDEHRFVLEAIEERGIRFVQLWFTDVLGMLKAFAIPAEEMSEALIEGASFDGSSIDGFARAQEADMIARPVPRTFQSLPWRPQDRGVARMYCDIIAPDGEAFQGDPRAVLRRSMERVRKLGFTAYIGPEIDMFLFRDAESPSPIDAGHYFDLTPLDVGNDFRRLTISYLEQIGIPVKDSHHEMAVSQHGVDLRHTDPLTMADSIMSFRLVVKQVAQELGCYATFMPKPLAGADGSGMHTHVSLFDGDRNVFFDPTQTHNLSKVGRSFVAGLLRHAAEITAVTNQWVNSYKRLVPGFDAPVDVCWGVRNRSTLVRIPLAKPGKEAACRVEYRAPDAACNPYLSLALILAAGVAGIEGEYELPPEAPDDLSRLSHSERRDRGILALPTSLERALETMEASELVRTTLGPHVFDWFLANKVEEWDDYRRSVTSFEVDRYLPRL